MPNNLPDLLLRYQKLEDIYNELVKQAYPCSFFIFQKGCKIVLEKLKQEDSQSTHVYKRQATQLLVQEFELDKLNAHIHELFRQVPEVLEIIQAVQ